jgi:cytosine/adenosine deaminase-related metal-dependent hydrolase
MNPLAVRSHVDVTDPRLLGVEALIEVRRVVPGSNSSLWPSPRMASTARAAHARPCYALDMGVDVLGGIPSFERLDPWYRLGTADMLDVAFMALHLAQMTSPEAMRRCFAMVTEENAAILGLEDYGLRPGARADLVLLDAADRIEALRLRPARLHVVSRCRLVARTDRAPTRMDLPGRPPSTDRRHVQRPR